MSKFHIMVTGHRIAVGEADTFKEVKEVYDRLNEHKGYRGKMKVLQEIDIDMNNPSPYPFPDYDSNIDEEETHS